MFTFRQFLENLVPRANNLKDAQAIIVKWSQDNPKPGVTDYYIKHYNKKDMSTIEAYKQLQQANEEWRKQWHLVRQQSGYDEYEKENYAQKQQVKIDAVLKKYGQELEALDWAQQHAGNNKDALRQATSIRMGYEPFGSIWRSWYPGAAAYAAKSIRKYGGKRDHTSGRSGARGSIYYTMPNGSRIRISDHELPNTPERVYNRSIGIQGKWEEIVLDNIMTQEEVDELINNILS